MSPDAPVVSILMNVYNGERFLEETLASVRAQTLADYELIVVDDGSTDRTVAIAQACAESDSRVRVIVEPHNTGGVACQNDALAAARAPYCAIWDQDDLSAAGRLARQVAFLEANPDVGVLGTWAWHIGERGRRAGVSEFGPLTREEFAELRERDAPLFAVGSSVVFRTALARAAGGFRPAFGPVSDADLWTRIGDESVLLILPERLVEYRVHAGSESTRSFFTQMTLLDLIAVNAGRRRSGLRELSRGEWERLLAGEAPARRLRRRRRWHARRLYRIGGGLLADRRPAGALYLAGAAVLDSRMVARRLRRQVAPFLATGR